MHPIKGTTNVTSNNPRTIQKVNTKQVRALSYSSFLFRGGPLRDTCARVAPTITVIISKK